MKKDQIFILKDRGVVFISGEDVKDFLQNIVTNDINKVNNNHSSFSSLLSPHGKYLFDFIIVKHKQGYFLDFEANQIDELINKLKSVKEFQFLKYTDFFNKIKNKNDILYWVAKFKDFKIDAISLYGCFKLFTFS